MLNLRGEYIYATDNEHIIASALGLSHSDSCSAASTFFSCECTDISCAVSDKRKSLFTDTCEYKFTILAVGKNFKGIGIDYFRIEVGQAG